MCDIVLLNNVDMTLTDSWFCFSAPTYGHMAESPWFIAMVVILVIMALSVFLFGGTKKVRDKKFEEKQSCKLITFTFKDTCTDQLNNDTFTL